MSQANPRRVDGTGPLHSVCQCEKFQSSMLVNGESKHLVFNRQLIGFADPHRRHRWPLSPFPIKLDYPKVSIALLDLYFVNRHFGRTRHLIGNWHGTTNGLSQGNSASTPHPVRRIVRRLGRLHIFIQYLRKMASQYIMSSLFCVIDASKHKKFAPFETLDRPLISIAVEG